MKREEMLNKIELLKKYNQHNDLFFGEYPDHKEATNLYDELAKEINCPSYADNDDIWLEGIVTDEYTGEITDDAKDYAAEYDIDLTQDRGTIIYEFAEETQKEVDRFIDKCYKFIDLKDDSKNELVRYLLNTSIEDEEEAKIDADTMYRYELGNKAQKELEAVHQFIREFEAEDKFIEIYLEALKETKEIRNNED